METGRLHSFSARRAPPSSRLALVFRLVRNFVARKDSSLAWTKLNVNCRDIVLFRKMNRGKVGERSLMHVGHLAGTVCSLSLVERANEGYLFGLLLHEFGHLGSGGGERDADAWILSNFGIRIVYAGPLDLEWVDQMAIMKVIGASTTLPRRNPRRTPSQSLRRPLPRRPQGVPTYRTP